MPALQRRCLFLRHQRMRTQPGLIPAIRSFSSTASTARGGGSLTQDKAQTKAAARFQNGPSPRVNFEKAQRDEGAMAEDIGLLQNTVIRAPFSRLPSPLTRPFWSYFWNLFKSKGTALYSRSAYKRCMHKEGWKRWLPEGFLDNASLKDRAEKLYVQIYSAFAAGNMKLIEQDCLPPLTQQFRNRLASRTVETEWQLNKFRSVRVVSHRASPLGEDQPDTAYRQAVLRIESEQTLSLKDVNAGHKRSHSSVGSPREAQRNGWKPIDLRFKNTVNASKQADDSITREFVGNGQPQKVVEYMVLQRRVIRGIEEQWKVQGFTQESTPATIKIDEDYWRRTLAIQAAS